MKLAIFSDIHGNYQALKAIFKKIGNDYDEVIFLGDAIGIGPDSYECVKLLQEKKVRFISGNHDLYYIRGPQIDEDLKGLQLEHHNWVTKTLKGISIEDNLRYDHNYGGVSFSFFHFFINNEEYPFEHLDIFNDNRYVNVFKKEKAKYVFYGHNHDEEFREIDGTKYYGVGSSGCTKNGKTYFYSVIIKDKNVSVKKVSVKYDRRSFVNRMKSINYPDKKAIENIFFGL